MEWIRIEDDLPEDLENVLFTDGKDVYKGYINKSVWGEWNYWFSISDVGIEDVTHWMPLPTMPKV